MTHDLDMLNWLITSRGARTPEGGWGRVMVVLDCGEDLWARAEAGLAFAGASYAKPDFQQLLVCDGQRCEEVVLPLVDAYQAEAEMEEFVTRMQEDRDPGRATAEEARQALLLAPACRQSLETGLPVALPDSSTGITRGGPR